VSRGFPDGPGSAGRGARRRSRSRFGLAARGNPAGWSGTGGRC